MSTPTFADTFAEAEAEALSEEDYLVAALLNAEGAERDRILSKMGARDQARYVARLFGAYTRLNLKANTKGRLCDPN